MIDERHVVEKTEGRFEKSGQRGGEGGWDARDMKAGRESAREAKRQRRMVTEERGRRVEWPAPMPKRCDDDGQPPAKAW